MTTLPPPPDILVNALAIECGRAGAPDEICSADTFNPALHPFEQNIPCCCPDSDGDGFMATFCNPVIEERGGDCQDEGEWADRRHPEADENAYTYRCDFLDNDCNGIVDDVFYPSLGPACASDSDCPEGYHCNRARDFVDARCALPCSENNGGEENSTYYCNDGMLKCLDTTAVEYCNGIDDDQDGLVDENYVNGEPPLGTACAIDFTTAGIVVCDPSGIGMICGIPPVYDAGHDAGTMDAGPGPGAWVWQDGGLIWQSDGGTLAFADGGYGGGPANDGGGLLSSEDAGMAGLVGDAGHVSFVGDGGRIIGQVDAAVIVTSAPDGGHTHGQPDGNGATNSPSLSDSDDGCSCRTNSSRASGSYLWLLLTLALVRRFRVGLSQ